jgi:RNA polymerase sigma-70 factor (ECF subfamily)
MSAQNISADWAAISDEQVMAAVKAGSVDAFEVLYDRYQERAYRVARAICRDYGQAEDAVQEAFGSIWKTRATYESQVGKVAPWVLSVGRYRAIDIARRDGGDAAHQTTDEPLHAVGAPGDVTQQVAAHAQTRRVLSLLVKLPDAQREVIMLAFYGELSHTEIAARLDSRLAPSRAASALGCNDFELISSDEPPALLESQGPLRRHRKYVARCARASWHHGPARHRRHDLFGVRPAEVLSRRQPGRKPGDHDRRPVDVRARSRCGGTRRDRDVGMLHRDQPARQPLDGLGVRP